jgi:hypothetical protein
MSGEKLTLAKLLEAKQILEANEITDFENLPPEQLERLHRAATAFAWLADAIDSGFLDSENGRVSYFENPDTERMALEWVAAKPLSRTIEQYLGSDTRLLFHPLLTEGNGACEVVSIVLDTASPQLLEKVLKGMNKKLEQDNASQDNLA